MAYLVATARYLPEKLVRNEDMVQFPERFRNTIVDKAGIYQRYHVEEGECTSDIGAKALQALLEKSGINPENVDALICATSSPDRIIPATATRIQELCGLSHAFAFDVNTACSGAVYALRLAASLVNDGLTNVVVVAAEVYSKLLNPKDIATYSYFGDGAAAALVSKTGVFELVDFEMGSDGGKADSAHIPAGGTMCPAAKVVHTDQLYISMKGKDIYEFACTKGPQTINTLIERNYEPDRVITHQANATIIREIARLTNIDLDKFFVNVDKYANTAGASVLIALDENLEKNTQDTSIILTAFGAGLSWGGCFLRRVG